MRSVIVAHKFRELRISGSDIILHGFLNLRAQARLVALRDRLRKLAQWVGKGTLLQRVIGNLLRLA